MKLSMQIFASCLDRFHPTVDIKSNHFEIEAVRLFSSDVTLSPNVMYIGRLIDLFRNGNDNIICTHNNDLIRLDTTDLEAVLNCVLDTLASFTAWDNRLMSLMTSGAMLQDLFDASEGILTRPVFLLDSGQRHLAHTRQYGTGDVDEQWDQLIEQGTCDMDFLIAFNQAEPERIQRKGIYSFGEKYFPNESYHYNFLAKDNFLGSATFVVPDKNLKIGELDRFKLFCQHLDQWFQMHIQEQDSIILDEQLRTAIRNPQADTSELKHRLILLGWTDTDDLMFLKLDAALQPYNINTYLTHSLNVSFPDLFAVTLDLSICLLCNLTRTSLEQTSQELTPWLQSSKYYATSGQIFHMNDSFCEHYRFLEMTSSCTDGEVGKIYDGKKHILRYLFSEMKHTVVPDILHPAVFLLKEYDRNHHTDLYLTLDTYLNHDRNIAETSRLLNIHRSTLLYRLERLRELITADLDDPQERLHLLLSFEIERSNM